MKKLLFLGFSLFCLSNLNAMDKITEEDYKKLKTAYERINSPSRFLSTQCGVISHSYNREMILDIFYKYDIRPPEHPANWAIMFRKMEENIEKNKGFFRKLMDFIIG